MGQCAKATFSLTGKDVSDCTDSVGMFNYLWRLLDHSGDNWPEIRRNISKARQVWGHLGKLLRREGAEPFVSEFVFVSSAVSVLLCCGD